MLQWAYVQFTYTAGILAVFRGEVLGMSVDPRECLNPSNLHTLQTAATKQPY